MRANSLLVAAALAVGACALATTPAPAPASSHPSFGYQAPRGKDRRRGKSEHRRRLDAWLVERNRKR
jgi:hypothetical protein